MRASFLLLFVIAAITFTACKKSGSDDGGGNPPPPPPPPPPVIDNGLDTLGNWSWVNDPANKVEGSQIIFVNPDTGYVVNDIFVPSAGIKATYNKGQTWLPGSSNYHLASFTACSRLYMISGKRGVLYGQYVPQRSISIYQPYLVDMNFNSANVFTGANFYGNNAYDFIQDIQLLGNMTFVLRDLGKLDLMTPNWTVYSFDPADKPISVQFISATHGWVGTEKGKLFRTIDGGKNWTQQLIENTSLAFYKIRFLNATTGWVVTNTNVLFRTVDGGATWQKIMIPGSVSYREVYYLEKNIAMVNASRGFINIEKSIYETNDGGLTWTRSCRVGQTDVEDISFDKGNTLWAITAKGLLKITL